MKSIFSYSGVVACILAASPLTGCSSHGQPAMHQPVRWSLTPPGGGVVAAAPATAQLAASIDDGWHIYAISQPLPGPAGGPVATRITLPAGQPFVAAGDAAPTTPPRVEYDDAFKMKVQLHSHAVAFNVPVQRADSAAAPAAADSLHVSVRYQVCNATLCLPPQTARLATPIAPAAQR